MAREGRDGCEGQKYGVSKSGALASLAVGLLTPARAGSLTYGRGTAGRLRMTRMGAWPRRAGSRSTMLRREETPRAQLV